MFAAGRVRAAVLATAVLLAGAALTPVTAAPAQAQDEGQASIPVAGTFSYYTNYRDTNALIRGAVHTVRRIPGGTAIYYSIGVAPGETWSPNLAFPPPGLGSVYPPLVASAVALVDTENLAYYQPLLGPDGCLCPRSPDLGTVGGTLYVGWAVMAPLPPEVETVGVSFGFGSQLEEVPVEDGALEPVVTETVGLELGQGWPTLPDQEAIAAVPDTTRFVQSLVRHVADVEQQVSTEEQAGEVAESLAADVLFAVDSATLTPGAQQTIAEVAARVAERASGEVQVIGHTDSSGDPGYNDSLSLARAEAVRSALQGGVGPGVTLVATGRGEAEPAADNGTPEGRTANRRVTVVYGVDGPS